ncbi:hypothetical protein QVD17_28758 [Tagetes erecta]|uniref:Uncharacterized protein n=1 Tax=Tagetes erecta TaxID=13708 RepID=A0AAD8NT04_TARER|nr:hypothetical protein QVD17_28758 [Tagetes erecta]
MPPNNYGDEEWRQFVDYRCSDKFQKRSSTNKGCRAKQEIVVRHGRKNLAQVRYDNRDVSSIELYRRMRVRNGAFTEPQAAQNYADMIQMRDDPLNTLTEDEIMQEVLGERRGWTRG